MSDVEVNVSEDEAILRAMEDMRALLDLPVGRRFIWRVLEQCGVYRNTFTGNSASYFQDGKKSIGLWLISEMESADLTAYPRLLLEQAQERQAEKAAEMARSTSDD